MTADSKAQRLSTRQAKDQASACRTLNTGTSEHIAYRCVACSSHSSMVQFCKHRVNARRLGGGYPSPLCGFANVDLWAAPKVILFRRPLARTAAQRDSRPSAELPAGGASALKRFPRKKTYLRGRGDAQPLMRCIAGLWEGLGQDGRHRFPSHPIPLAVRRSVCNRLEVNTY